MPVYLFAGIIIADKCPQGLRLMPRYSAQERPQERPQEIRDWIARRAATNQRNVNHRSGRKPERERESETPLDPQEPREPQQAQAPPNRELHNGAHPADVLHLAKRGQESNKNRRPNQQHGGLATAPPGQLIPFLVQQEAIMATHALTALDEWLGMQWGEEIYLVVDSQPPAQHDDPAHHSPATIPWQPPAIDR